MAETKAPRRRGCVFYGCLTFGVLSILAILMVYAGYRWFLGQLNAYTSNQPVPLPQVEMSDTEFQELKKKVDAFAATFETGKEEQTLSLTAEEINALIWKYPGLGEKLRNKVFVTVGEEAITADFSIPVSEMFPRVENKYLNGSATFKVVAVNGKLELFLQSLTINGKKPEPQFLNEMVQQNLAKDFYNDPETAKVLNRVEEVQVKDGEVLITIKPAPVGAAQAPANAPAP